MGDKYWDMGMVLCGVSFEAYRDWEHVIDIQETEKLEQYVVGVCREWYGIKDETLFNLQVDLVLAEVFELSNHMNIPETDIDLIVMIIGNMLSSKLLKSGRNWFKMAYPE